MSSRQAEQHVGLTGAQLFVLQQLGHSPCASLNDLASRTMTHQSSVSVVVTRLVAKGLVRRVPSSVDARRRELALTPRGRTALSRAPELAQELLIEAVGALSPKTRAGLANGLRDVVRHMGIDDARPAHLFFDGESAVGLGARAPSKRVEGDKKRSTRRTR